MPRRIVVVGGGIAGLACAHRLHAGARGKPDAPELFLLEASDRVGGAIRTERRDGFLLEGGPDNFITEKPGAVALCRELGLEGDLVGVTPENRRSFVLREGCLHPVPEGFYLFAPVRPGPFLRSKLLSTVGKARALAERFLPARRDVGADESVRDFIVRRFGREVYERIAQPMIGGIWTSDPAALSLRATFARFLDMEREHGSVLRGMRARRRAGGGGASSESAASGPRYGLFATLKGGLGRMVEGIVGRLPPGTIWTRAPVTGLERAGDRWVVRGSDGEAVEADGVCVALPAPRAAELLGPVHADLASDLSAIPCASSAVLLLGFRRADVPHPLDGSGFVVPILEGRSFLACSFSSSKYPGRAPDGHVLLRVFLGGSLQPEILDLDDDPLVARVLGELREILGIVGEPVLSHLVRHRDAMPQYVLGHADRAARIESAAATLPGLALAGNYFHAVGIPDCIASGEAAAGRLVAADA